MRDYQVQLEVFSGPLDLLLYLVKRDEIDLRDIPVARVAEQFREYLDVIQFVDLERAGEFLVMASTLTELKSRMLLPRLDEQSLEEEDPRQELVRQLLEYKRFKDAAAILDEQARRQETRLSRHPPPPPSSNTPAPLRPVELWDLVSAFGRLLRETLANQPHFVATDPTPLHVYTDQVLARLESEGRLLFSELFTPPHTRARLVGYFLAVLELTRQSRVLAEQSDVFGDLWVWLNTRPSTFDEPETTPLPSG